MQRGFRLRQGCGGLAVALRAKAVGFEVLACPRCAGRMRLVALIHAPNVIERILRHLALPTEVPHLRPSRDPPLGRVLEASAGLR